VLSWFTGDARGYVDWLAGHSDQYVVVIDRIARLADVPVDTAGRPRLAVAVPTHRVLHRAACPAVAGPTADHIRICGPRDELVASFEGDPVPRCPGCLPDEPEP
jgi:hypothetical protein